MKIIMLMLLLFQQQIFAGQLGSRGLTQCQANPNSPDLDCPNDPFYNDAYEMDAMNFAQAWDKSYGTARVFIKGFRVSPEMVDDPEFGSRLRVHDLGTYYTFNTYNENSSSGEKCRPISPDSNAKQFYFFGSDSERTEGAVNLYQTDLSYFPDIFINEFSMPRRTQQNPPPAHTYLEVAVKVGVPTHNIKLNLIDSTTGKATEYSLENDFTVNLNNTFDGYNFYFIKGLDFGVQLTAQILQQKYVVDISQGNKTIQRIAKFNPEGPMVTAVTVVRSSGESSLDGFEASSSLRDCGQYRSGLHVIGWDGDTAINFKHGDLILGLYSSTTDNGIGMSSICRECSIAFSYSVARLNAELGGSEEDKLDEKFQQIYIPFLNAIEQGNQILSFSGAINDESYLSCDQQSIQQSFCGILEKSKARDLVFVASAGNSVTAKMNWPAKETDYVIGVGGTDELGAIWKENPCPLANTTDECGTQFDPVKSRVVAPAQDVLLYHRNGDYHPDLGCFDVDFGTSDDGYQFCSGTSFSAPIIGGVVSIMRSLNPLLSFDEIKDMLRTSRVSTDNQNRTYSIPDAGALVKDILGQSDGQDVANRLKPMFRLNHTFNRNGIKNNYLSTTIPQLAVAAIDGTYLIEPRMLTGTIILEDTISYDVDTDADVAIGYPQFRAESSFSGSLDAHAPFYIFGGHENPINGADDMIPLYHFAYRADKSNSSCYDEADHGYATNNNNAFVNNQTIKCNEFLKEGIEGYLFPNCHPSADGCYENTGNPNHMQCLRIRYSVADDSYGLYMESEQNTKFNSYQTVINGQPGMSNSECLGYVFPNVDSDSDFLIDGMEWVLGTDPSDSDSDDDGLWDGVEYPPTVKFLSDPLLCVGSSCNTTTVPDLVSAETSCNHHYCILLLGHDFGTDSYVDIHADINGGPVLKRIQGNDIYNRSPINGEERISFPIQDFDLQNKLNTTGLCFEVVDSPESSNIVCTTRTNTTPQGLFMGKTVESYKLGTQDVEHTSYVVVGNGEKLRLLGNSWKKIAYNYTVTPNTVLEFSFKSWQQEPEINGIGFIMDGSSGVSSSKMWQVYGTQGAGGRNHDFHDYPGTGWKTYRIPIGETFTGQISY